ncbi:hypothetical protein L1987_60067 [Smallanthus sonchifolius]|uniref:Uncharacterized protein n=1 Tax=Smallanthus sonchifolius TaxID=185202 RepID=A0ACB9D734_9ASTR|nr:hypothetical protein L1987_60067 [Smallanthus sonchifolius]
MRRTFPAISLSGFRRWPERDSNVELDFSNEVQTDSSHSSCCHAVLLHPMVLQYSRGLGNQGWENHICSENQDLDLTVLALESPPDGFLLVSDGPYASLGLANHPNVSFLDSHNNSASSTDTHVRNASLSVSHELTALFSISQEPSTPFSDLHEPNVSFTVSHDAKLLFPVSDEPRLSYAGKNNKTEQQASGEGS